MIILANPRSDWNVLRPLLFESIGQTLTMVLVTLVIGGFLGLILGVVLYGTRPGNLFENAVVYRILDIIVNIVRPIPFIIFLAAMQPLTIVVVGTPIGTDISHCGRAQRNKPASPFTISPPRASTVKPSKSSVRAASQSVVSAQLRKCASTLLPHSRACSGVQPSRR